MAKKPNPKKNRAPTPIKNGIIPPDQAAPMQGPIGIPINKLFEALGRAQLTANLLEEELMVTRQALQAAQARIDELEGAGMDTHDAGGD